MQTIIKNIEIVRQIRGMSEETFCTKAMINPRTYRNRKKSPEDFRLKELSLIAGALKVKREDLIIGSIFKEI